MLELCHCTGGVAGWAAGRDGTSRPIYCCSSDLAWKIVSWIPQPNPGWGRTSRIHLLQWLILATQCTKPEIWLHRIVWGFSISVNKIFAKIRNGGKYRLYIKIDVVSMEVILLLNGKEPCLSDIWGDSVGGRVWVLAGVWGNGRQLSTINIGDGDGGSRLGNL